MSYYHECPDCGLKPHDSTVGRFRKEVSNAV